MDFDFHFEKIIVIKCLECNGVRILPTSFKRTVESENAAMKAFGDWQYGICRDCFDFMRKAEERGYEKKK